MNQLNMHRDQILDIAVRIEFFRELTYPELCRFIDLKTHLYHYAEDEYLIRDGDKDDDSALFILLTGKVGVSKDGRDISEIHSGDCFGEISFITGEQRTADVKALDQCIVIRLNRSTYKRLSDEIREKIKDSIIRKLISRIDFMNKRCTSMQNGTHEFGVL